MTPCYLLLLLIIVSLLEPSMLNFIFQLLDQVVWRKLGDAGDIGSFNESSDSITEPPFVPDTGSKPDVTSSTDLPYAQSLVNGYIGTQPQPQMTSTPLSAGMKSANVGHHFNPAPSDHFLGSSVHPSHVQRQPAFRPSQEQPSSKSSNTQGQAVQGFRNRQNSASERLAADKSKTFPYKQFMDQQDDRRNAENKHPPHIISDVNGKPNLQQFSYHQQPPAVPAHQQQQSLPDMAYHPPQRHTDPTAKPLHKFQQPPPAAHHQQSITDQNTNSHPSQRPADLTSGPVDRQQRPPPAYFPSTTAPRNQNQRSFDPQSSQLQSGHLYSQHSELDNAVRNPPEVPQHKRGAQDRPYQQVKLLDAPGTGRQFQRLAPRQGQGHDREWFHEESGSNMQIRQQSRGESAYADRNSADRETYQQPTSRSLSSSSVLNPSTSHTQAQNLQGAKSIQNLKGPSGFRAYPPQLSSVPTKPVLSGPQSQEVSTSGSLHQQDPALRGSHLSGNQPQNRSNPVGKRFQEQEWRQTYLDDSDTL